MNPVPELTDEFRIAQGLRSEIDSSTHHAKRLKLRTLLAKFGYQKRSDSNTGKITEALGAVGISINPPIIRFGEEWEISVEDWIYLSDPSHIQPQRSGSKKVTDPFQNRPDPWFDKISGMSLRTEKEVEIKFIVPLLFRLGYDDDDRYDGMPVPAAHGSRNTTLVIDFALFNSQSESLRHQPLLTVEAKKEDRLKKREELLKAHNQAKSYCLWTQCDYYLISDSKSIQAFHIERGNLNDLSPIFSCERHELKEQFSALYSLISKESLTNYYLSKFSTTDESF